MTEGIIIAVITGGLALLGNILVASVNNSKTLYRIEQLEKKVDKFSDQNANIVSRLTVVERDVKTYFDIINELKSEIQEIRRKF